MVRSLKILGAVFSIIAGTSTAFSPQHSRISSRWGVASTTNDVMRTIPATALPAVVAAKAETVVMMPATLDKPAVRTGGGPAVLDRPAVERKRNKDPVKERKSTGSDAWEVRIYNDGMNTREHVARSLVQVTGLSEIRAYQTMMRAHQDGIASVGTWCFEVAEMYNDGLQKNGIISDIVPVDEEK